MKTLVDIMVERNIRNDTHYEFGTDKEFNHRYCTYFYDQEFALYRDLPIALFEIGVHRGGSLAVFHEYFANAIVIAGVDPVDFGAEANCRPYPRVRVIAGNGYDPAFVADLPNFDIIIDDGPHTRDSHITTLNLYPKLLNPGGVLVIEDIADIAWCDHYRELVPEHMTTEVVDIREPSGMKDSVLFVVRNPIG